MKLAMLLLTLNLSGQTVVRYWTGDHPKAGLAQWAMEDWARIAAGGIKLEKVASEAEADIFFVWDNGRSGLYGQAQRLRQNGRPVNRVLINTASPNLDEGTGVTAAKDPLFLDVMLYLTCVHESGHALGLEHTKDFADIMYSFQYGGDFVEYGGDFVEYFQRYRRKLKTRDDMAKVSVASPNDVIQLRKLWPAGTRK